MHIDLGNDLDTGPLPKSYIGWKIAAFIASCALAFSGTINGVMAFTAYIGGDLVGAVGKGADVALERHSDVPDEDRMIHDKDIQSLSEGAHHFALRAKLIAIGIGIVAAIQLLCGVLVRKRLRTKFIPIVLAIAIVGEVAMMVAVGPGFLTGFGVLTCIYGLLVWWQTPPEDELSRMNSWGG